MTAKQASLKRKIEYVPIGKVRAAPGNLRHHKPSQIALIAASMAEHGNINPLLVDETLELIAGHGRLAAAELNGLEQVPVIRLAHLTPARKRLYRIADNRLAELSSWSGADLVAEFASIELDMPSLDLQLSGFQLEQIDGFRDAEDVKAEQADDEVAPPALSSVATSQTGDVWLIGDHRLVCGDALEAATYQLLLGRERPAMIFTDPPYNVPIGGHVSGLGRTKHREFVQGTGEMSDAEFQGFLLGFMRHCARVAKPGALHYCCMDWRHIRHLLTAGTAAYAELLNICVWNKTNAGMGSLYRSAHELIAVFKSGKAGHRNNVQLGAAGRHRTNVWTFAGMNVPGAGRDKALALHPTVKPVALVREAILDVTARGDLVLDSFGGSGTTLLAAHRVGRVARLIELDRLYCDVILRRAGQALKLEPILQATGKTFADVATRRAKGAADA